MKVYIKDGMITACILYLPYSGVRFKFKNHLLNVKLPDCARFKNLLMWKRYLKLYFTENIFLYYEILQQTDFYDNNFKKNS